MPDMERRENKGEKGTWKLPTKQGLTPFRDADGDGSPVLGPVLWTRWTDKQSMPARMAVYWRVIAFEFEAQVEDQTSWYPLGGDEAVWCVKGAVRFRLIFRRLEHLRV